MWRRVSATLLVPSRLPDRDLGQGVQPELPVGRRPVVQLRCEDQLRTAARRTARYPFGVLRARRKITIATTEDTRL